MFVDGIFKSRKDLLAPSLLQSMNVSKQNLNFYITMYQRSREMLQA